MNPWLAVLIGTVAVVGVVVAFRVYHFRFTPIMRPTGAEVGDGQLAALEAFGRLTIGERLKIRLLVRRGEQLPEPRLVPAAVVHARRAILDERVRLSRVQWPQLLTPVLGSLAVLIANDFELQAWNTCILLGWVGFVGIVLSPGRGLLRRYQRALLLNESVLSPAPDTAGTSYPTTTVSPSTSGHDISQPFRHEP